MDSRTYGLALAALENGIIPMMANDLTYFPWSQKSDENDRMWATPPRRSTPLEALAAGAEALGLSSVTEGMVSATAEHFKVACHKALDESFRFLIQANMLRVDIVDVIAGDVFAALSATPQGENVAVKHDHYLIIGHYTQKPIGCCSEVGLADVKEEEPLATVKPWPKETCPICNKDNPPVSSEGVK